MLLGHNSALAHQECVAPTMPQRVHTMRGPKAGTGTASQ
jgi:hypothetical protein